MSNYFPGRGGGPGFGKGGGGEPSEAGKRARVRSSPAGRGQRGRDAPGRIPPGRKRPSRPDLNGSRRQARRQARTEAAAGPADSEEVGATAHAGRLCRRLVSVPAATRALVRLPPTCGRARPPPPGRPGTPRRCPVSAGHGPPLRGRSAPGPRVVDGKQDHAV